MKCGACGYQGIEISGEEASRDFIQIYGPFLRDGKERKEKALLYACPKCLSVQLFLNRS